MAARGLVLLNHTRFLKEKRPKEVINVKHSSKADWAL